MERAPSRHLFPLHAFPLFPPLACPHQLFPSSDPSPLSQSCPLPRLCPKSCRTVRSGSQTTLLQMLILFSLCPCPFISATCLNPTCIKPALLLRSSSLSSSSFAGGHRVGLTMSIHQASSISTNQLLMAPPVTPFKGSPFSSVASLTSALHLPR